ncbi:hydrogenase maturation protease [Parafrankia irregularis]|uniref:Hydrogenase maturation protease n=1 Tax=Parafrankia irregularis TaxID=795642 RepID=A0A0S4QR77_9ACTN|nr:MULTISPECIES: hydrogenase maturation protease [Parafrankia]MBE3199834.1 hydrogenase maturation protease [Parafrankia sp. CH37]CUU57987.1 hydrogenase maturation protease [Parafrankia irregularis]
MNPPTLVAGVGNVLLADDGFGVEVVRRLLDVGPPPGVTVADYGISGMQLALDLCSGYGAVVLVDALGRGHPPGTVSLLDLGGAREPVGFDAHGMRPDAVLDLVATLGGHLDRALLVGCEPAIVHPQIGLSAQVAAAVEPAARLVRSVVEDVAASEEAPETPAHSYSHSNSNSNSRRS